MYLWLAINSDDLADFFDMSDAMFGPFDDWDIDRLGIAL